MAGNEQANGAEDIAGLPFLQTFEDFRLECLRCGDAEVEAFGAGGNNEGLEFVELQIDHNPFASSLDFPDDRQPLEDGGVVADSVDPLDGVNFGHCQEAVEMTQHALAVEMKDVVGHVRDLVSERRQVKLVEDFRRYHAGEVTTGDMEFPPGRDANPGYRGLAVLFEDRVIVVEDRKEVLVCQADQAAHIFGAVNKVQAEQLWVPPVSGAVQAAVQIDVADQEFAGAFLQGDLREVFDFLAIDVVTAELETRHILPIVDAMLYPGGDFSELEVGAVKGGVHVRAQVGAEHREGFAVKGAAADGLQKVVNLELGIEPARFEVGPGAVPERVGVGKGGIVL